MGCAGQQDPGQRPEDSGVTTGDSGGSGDASDHSDGADDGRADAGTMSLDGACGRGIADADVGDVMVPVCTPATLQPMTAAQGPFCPYLAGAGPKGGNCAVDEYCCKPSGASRGACVAAGAGGANPCCADQTALQCEDDLQCNAGKGGLVCCGTGTVKQDPACTGTTAYFGSGFNSTKCSASCGPGTLHMCTQPTGECAAGTTCTPFKSRGGQFGACQ